MYLNSIDYFRAITIMIIVAAHCDGLLVLWHPSSIPEKAFINFIRGGSHFFVFISGFLFHEVYYKKFYYTKFINKKISKVLLPYLIMSFVPVIYLTFIKNRGFYEVQEMKDSVFNVMIYYATGSTFEPYWYIPFIMIIFIVSPIFIIFINANIRIQVCVFTVTYLIAMIIHRPIDNINVVQNVMYFSPIYLFGILCSMYKKDIYELSRSWVILLYAAAAIILIFQANSTDVIGNYHKDLFRFNGIDIMLIQKTIMALALMVWLHKYEQKNNKYLKYMATVSFPIYFLHPYIIIIIIKLKLSHINIYIDSNIISLLLYTFMVVGSCMILASIIKKYFKKYSHIFIGW